MNLTEIANKLGTDKGTLQSVWGHGYTETYDKLFSPLLKIHVKMIEIGVADPRFPGASIKMWVQYFQNLELIGFDINPDALDFAEKNVKIFIGDQNDPIQLQSCIAIFGKDYDIIIDDGSHYGEHILTSFENLFPYVKSGGYYIIEDLHSAYTNADITLPKLYEIIEKNNWKLTKTFEHGGKMLIIKKE